MHGMLNIAIRAARKAGDIMIRQINKLESLEIAEKGRNDFVTGVDRRAEEAIIEVVKDHYPDHAILAEESGSSGDNEYQWIIDPLDGTTNYLHGFPVFSVSIAVAHEGELQHATAASCNFSSFAPPEAVHGRSVAQAITGGAVYRGAAIPGLQGFYVYGDFVTGRFFAFDSQVLDAPVQGVALPPTPVSSFGQGRDGEIYVVSFGAPSIQKIVPGSG